MTAAVQSRASPSFSSWFIGSGGSTIHVVKIGNEYSKFIVHMRNSVDREEIQCGLIIIGLASR